MCLFYFLLTKTTKLIHYAQSASNIGLQCLPRSGCHSEGGLAPSQLLLRVILGIIRLGWYVCRWSRWSASLKSTNFIMLSSFHAICWNCLWSNWGIWWACKFNGFLFCFHFPSSSSRGNCFFCLPPFSLSFQHCFCNFCVTAFISVVSHCRPQTFNGYQSVWWLVTLMALGTYMIFGVQQIISDTYKSNRINFTAF